MQNLYKSEPTQITFETCTNLVRSMFCTKLYPSLAPADGTNSGLVLELYKVGLGPLHVSVEHLRSVSAGMCPGCARLRCARACVRERLLTSPLGPQPRQLLLPIRPLHGALPLTCLLYPQAMRSAVRLSVAACLPGEPPKTQPRPSGRTANGG